MGENRIGMQQTIDAARDAGRAQQAPAGAALPPVPFFWDGEAMRPRLPKLADRLYVIGEVYPLAPDWPRSKKSHDHYFALVAEAWKNLPEDQAERWPTEEHLRKWALIKAGYRDERTHVCASRAEAQRLRAFIKPIDDMAIVLANAGVVTVYTAQSQSLKAMGRRVFQESKDRVLAILSEVIGSDVASLRNNAEAVA